MRPPLHLRTLLTTIVACLFGPFVSAQDLGVRDPAPPLHVAEWLRGEPLTGFEPGQVYVVDFWATWCGPCRVSMPHLTEVQKRFGDKVRVLAVSIWEDDPSSVKRFVDRNSDQIGFRVARDLVTEEMPSGAMAKGWMKAFDQRTIPTAFVVDGSGRVAWIGAPEELQGPLEKIVAGSWDLEAARVAHAKRMERIRRLREARTKMQAAKKALQWKEAVAAAEKLIQCDAGCELEAAPIKFEGLLRLGLRDKAYAYGYGLVNGAGKNQAKFLNHLAWILVDPATPPIPDRDLGLARKAAERANELTGGREPAILDTLALVLFEAGEVEKALELQTKAVELAKGTRLEKELRGRLELFQRAAQNLALRR